MTGKQAAAIIGACAAGAGMAAAASDAPDVQQKSKAVALGAGIGALLGIIAISKNKKETIKELAVEGIGFASNFFGTEK